MDHGLLVVPRPVQQIRQIVAQGRLPVPVAPGRAACQRGQEMALRAGKVAPIRQGQGQIVASGNLRSRIRQTAGRFQTRLQMADSPCAVAPAARQQAEKIGHLRLGLGVVAGERRTLGFLGQG